MENDHIVLQQDYHKRHYSHSLAFRDQDAPSRYFFFLNYFALTIFAFLLDCARALMMSRHSEVAVRGRTAWLTADTPWEFWLLVTQKGGHDRVPHIPPPRDVAVLAAQIVFIVLLLRAEFHENPLAKTGVPQEAARTVTFHTALLCFCPTLFKVYFSALCWKYFHEESSLKLTELRVWLLVRD